MEAQKPSDFLQNVIGKSVVVRLNSGIEYHGVMSSLDGYMNIALEQTVEYSGGEKTNEYGDCFIRGNNMLIGADPAKDQYDQEQVETSTIQHLIHEYLIHNCYTETALAFGKHLLLDVDMDLLQRKEIKEYILLGNIKEALDSLEKWYPSLLLNTQFMFLLKSQQFIELIKQGGDCLLFATQELGTYSHFKELENVVSLIAYPNPSESPMAFYLSQEQREKVAMKVNDAILELKGCKFNKLDRLVRQSVVVRDVLQESKVYPKWSLDLL